MNFASRILTIALAAVLTAITASAQAPASNRPSAEGALSSPAAPDQSAARRCDEEKAGPTRTFYLNNSVQSSEANEIVTAIRNFLDPCDRVYLVASQSAIVIKASDEQIAAAQKIISGLDRPKRTYRLTYTVTDVDNGKRVGTQHFAMVVVSGQETKLKQGSKVPLATGTYNATPTGGEHPQPAGSQTQFTYLDIGMNFSATLDEFASGVRLRSNVEESSVAGQNLIAGVEEPVIRQTSLTGAAFLTPGKPLMLGTIDIPGSTRHLDVEVVMEQLP